MKKKASKKQPKKEIVIKTTATFDEIIKGAITHKQNKAKAK